MSNRTRTLASLASVALLLPSLAACSGTDDPTADPGATAGASGAAGAAGGAGGGGGSAGAGGSVGGAAAYQVATVGTPALTVGKSALQLRIQNGDATPATGLAGAIALSPLMTMPQMSHGGPVPPDAVVESAVPGTYDVTLFFPMASTDASGMSMGQWTLDVAVGKQSPVRLDLAVAPPKTTDTTHVALQNASDTIASSKGPSNRKYMVFRDTLQAAAGGHQVGIFLATIQEGNMVWPPVTTGLVLKDGSGATQLTIDSVEVSGSVDGSTWTPMPCGQNARCMGVLPGSPSPGKVFVKLRINGKDYTTDGMAPNADPAKPNAFATFVVTGGS